MKENRLLPAEWEQHRATWISWPHEPADWPGKFPVIDWVYSEIVRHLAHSETVEILCHNQQIIDRANECLSKTGISENYNLHLQASDRSWLRDSAPTAVRTAKGIEWIRWKFNAWAKYKNFSQDIEVPQRVSTISRLPITDALHPTKATPVILEGGAIESDGQGTMLTTEECLLSPIQERNPGFTREDYELVFNQYLGTTKTIWLDRSCEGDDTHGHIDDVARFVAPGKVVLSYEEDSTDPNHTACEENYSRLLAARDAQGRALEVIKLPMPRPLWFDGYRLPASYANFYIANKVVLVPTFNDPQDRLVISILSDLFPEREVIGIHCLDLVLGFGTLHCLTQQEPINIS